MCIFDVTYQQHPFSTKKGMGTWSDVCFSGGMGSKPKGFLYSFLLPQTKHLFNNPLVSTPVDIDEAKPEKVKAWLEAGLTKLEEIAAEENYGG